MNIVRLISYLTLIGLILTSCGSKKKIEVYSLSGENDFIKVCNGLIIIADDIEEFIGGELFLKDEQIKDVSTYKKEFYYYEDGDKATIRSFIFKLITDADDERTIGEEIGKDLGSNSSKNLFKYADLQAIIDTLHFNLSGNFINGEYFEYNIDIDVKQVY